MYTIATTVIYTPPTAVATVAFGQQTFRNQPLVRRPTVATARSLFGLRFAAIDFILYGRLYAHNRGTVRSNTFSRTRERNNNPNVTVIPISKVFRGQINRRKGRDPGNFTVKPLITFGIERISLNGNYENAYRPLCIMQ